MMLAKYSASRRAADEAALTALGGISGTRMRRQASATPPLLRNHRASARLLSAITDRATKIAGKIFEPSQAGPKGEVHGRTE
jgi:hypothetical protein